MSSDAPAVLLQEQKPDETTESREINSAEIQEKQTEEQNLSPAALQDLLRQAKEENEKQRCLMEAQLLQFKQEKDAWALREQELISTKLHFEKSKPEGGTEELSPQQKEKMEKLESDLKSSTEELKNLKEQLEKAQERINSFESASKDPGRNNAGPKQMKGHNDKSQQQQGNTLDEEGLRRENGKLRTALMTAVARLKDKSIQAASLEKQNEQIKAQVISLKEVTGITKELLSIRNSEVEHLRSEMEAVEARIQAEKEQRSQAIARVEKATRLNADLKREYQIQFSTFKALKSKYEEKVELLSSENKRLVREANAEGRPDVELNVGPIATDDEEAPQH